MSIAEWQPGKLYAPGDVVKPRITAAVNQSLLDNPTFESGDTGWPTGSEWTIVQETPFVGTWNAKFVAPPGGKLVFNADGGGGEVIVATEDGASFAQNFHALELVAASGTIFVGVHSTLGSNFTSSDGETWVDRTSSNAWGSPTFSCLHYDTLTNLFILCEAGDRTYYTSPDGITWTSREFPGSVSLGNTPAQGFATDGTTLVMLRSSGETHYSTDAINWTLLNDIGSGSCIVWASGESKFFAFDVDSNTYDVWTSPDGVTNFVKETGANLDSQINSNNPISVAYNGSTFVVMAQWGTPGGTTDKLATSPDGITWTARNAYGGVYVGWSATLGKFVIADGTTVSWGFNPKLYTSSDGITWSTGVEYYSSEAAASWPFADLTVTPAAISSMVNDARLSVRPGNKISAKVFAKITGDFMARVGIAWYNSGGSQLSVTWTDTPESLTGAYRRVTVDGAVAPDNAASCSVALGVTGQGTKVEFDNVTISHTDPVTISELVFKATQAEAGYSDSFEPIWPTVVGNTVVDNEVIWEGVPANRVVWQTFAILVSGSSEPTFPAAVGAAVADNTISWIADTRRVEDPNCPNTAAVAITASKIFAGDKDIIPFSATVNPLDWTTANDAGYIPFGLNTYGSQDVTALGLYRSNLVAFNSKGFQMWQVDEDPTNFAILDAVPVGIPSSGAMSIQPVMNDLVFMVEVGIRSMGIAGASSNLAAGQFGKGIDPLVKAKLKAGEVPISLFYPGEGQYWLIFGAEAFVLTMNAGKGEMSWSRYTFPAAIDDWTILDKDLYLRSGDKILRLSDAAIRDEQVGEPPTSGVLFEGEIWWHYLDFGGLGDDKMMLGFELVGEGEVTVTFGYNQKDTSKATADYTLADINSVPGTMIPMPITAPSIQMRLVFSSDQEWEWTAAALYLQDQRTGS